MKFSKSETRYLEFYCPSTDMEEEVNGTSDFFLNIIEKEGSKEFSITWRLHFFNDFGKDVYTQTTEIRFEYSFLGKIENDFRDLKIFLGNFVWSIYKNLLAKNERLLFPEVNLEILTCQVLEKIIMNA